MIRARDLARRIALSKPGYVVDKVAAGLRGIATNFHLPDIDFKPEKYNGPSKDEVKALRKRYLNPGMYTWQLLIECVFDLMMIMMMPTLSFILLRLAGVMYLWLLICDFTSRFACLW